MISVRFGNGLIEIIQPHNDSDIQSVKELFLEYASWLGFDLCFQGFDEELAGLPGKYSPENGGRLYLLKDDGKTAACIALRKIEDGICEMKRLYVKPEFRGKHYGILLANKVIDEAKELGYKRMRLDTIGSKMKSAMALYKSLGFYEIEAYYYNPQPGVNYMELDLETPPLCLPLIGGE